MSKSLRKFFYAVGATATVGTACLGLERTPGIVDPESQVGNAASIIIAVVRFTRSLHTAAVIMADYRHIFSQFDDYQSAEYKSARSVVHERSADRLLTLARSQGAVYVKIGQHVASMNHAVPQEYSNKLKLLEDRAAYRPYWQIERMLNRELSPRLVTDVFEHIETKPVAAASLAQVHRATLRQTGETVAVKIQYPGLAALVQGDLVSIRVLSKLLKWAFPFFDMEWVVDQFRNNLQKELDFKLEAVSANRTASCFRHDDRISVPKIYKHPSTGRILVMEYIDGWRIDDVEKIREAGINPRHVAQAVVDAFAQMIFIDGFVHCDPHAGNLMVRPSGKKKGGFEVYLLDHGLYRELDDEFRQSYCKLWRGLVLRRSLDVENACKELGASGLENVFAIMLLNRSWTSARHIGTDIRMKMNTKEMKQLRNDLRDSGLTSQADVSSFIERIPDDLFLVFKMNGLVRNVNKALGASVNRFKVNARYAVRGLKHLNGPMGKRGVPGEDEKMAVIVASTGVENGLFDFVHDQLQRIFNWFDNSMDRVLMEMDLFSLDVAWFVITWWFGRIEIIDGSKSNEPSSGDGVADMNLLG